MMTLFLKEISKYTSLTKEETFSLIIKGNNSGFSCGEIEIILKGNIKSMLNCITHNFTKIGMEDIISGMIGFEKAIRKFDVTKDLALITYAQHYIRREVKSYRAKEQPSMSGLYSHRLNISKVEDNKILSCMTLGSINDYVGDKTGKFEIYDNKLITSLTGERYITPEKR